MAIRWLDRPRHWRYLWLAACRAGGADARGTFDGWIAHRLSWCRTAALAAGMAAEDVDALIVAGLDQGRIDAGESGWREPTTDETDEG